MHAVPTRIGNERIGARKLTVESRRREAEAAGGHARSALAPDDIEQHVGRDVVRPLDAEGRNLAQPRGVARHEGGRGVVRRHVRLGNAVGGVEVEASGRRVEQATRDQRRLDGACGIDRSAGVELRMNPRAAARDGPDHDRRPVEPGSRRHFR